MANIFLPLPAPGANGVGAAVDVSTMGGLKTIQMNGSWVLPDRPPTINIEMNNDAGQAGTWAPVCTFQGGSPAQLQTVENAARWLRVRVSNYRGGSAPDVNVGSTDDGAEFAALPSTTGNGTGTVVDISALPALKTLQVGNTFSGSVILETSEDAGGTDWVQVAALQAPGQFTFTQIAKWARIRRTGSKSDTTIICTLGATQGATGGGGNTPFVFNAVMSANVTGLEVDFSPAGWDQASWWRLTPTTTPATIASIGALPQGTLVFIENVSTTLPMTILNNGAGTAGNLITTPDGQPIEVPPGGGTLLVYDATALRFRFFGLATGYPTPSLDARAFGVVGDGVADDRIALTLAVASAIATGRPLQMTNLNIVLSKYIYVNNALNIRFIGNNTTIRYPSDDTRLVADGIAVTNQEARSAFLLRQCQNVTFEGSFTFIGGDSQEVETVNVGYAIYSTRCVGITVGPGILQYAGYSLYGNDSLLDTVGTGDSLTFNGGLVTLACAAATFSKAQQNLQITISGAPTLGNNGTFIVRHVIDPTHIVFANPTGVTEVSAAIQWSVADGDSNCNLIGCTLRSVRGPTRIPSNSVIENCRFEQPLNMDVTGQGDALSFGGGVVTLFDAAARFTATMVGKNIQIFNATNGANNVQARIASVIDPSHLTFANAAGVAEKVFPGQWWIQNGDKAGFGTSLALAGRTVTFTAPAGSFAAGDLNKTVRISNPTTQGNFGSFSIAAVLNDHQITYDNPLGASEAYTGGWAIDAFDNGAVNGNTIGSTPSIYIFGGERARTKLKMRGNFFSGSRLTAIKVSSSATPIEDVEISGNSFYECGAAVIAGADDSQRHSGIQIEDNQIIDCGTGRLGVSNSTAIQILGSRDVEIIGNTFRYTQNAVANYDGRGGQGVFGVSAQRWVAGISQPLENIIVANNSFHGDPSTTTPDLIMNTAVQLEAAGISAYYLYQDAIFSAKVGNTMTMFSPQAKFSQQLVGWLIRITLAPNGGNNSPIGPTGVPTPFVVTSVIDGQTLTFENAAGVAGDVRVGSYAILPPVGERGGCSRVQGNQFVLCAHTAVQTLSCVGVEVVDNDCVGLANLLIDNGSVSLRADRLRDMGSASVNAKIIVAATTSWPIIGNNTITNPAINGAVAVRTDVSIGADSSTNPSDFPLCGMRGRMKPSGGIPQIVFPFGSLLVAGDSINICETKLTYVPSAPGANQFSDLAGLVALINAIAVVGGNLAAVDYGSQFAPAVVTGHILVTAPLENVDNTVIYVQHIDITNPTGLPVLRNDTAGNEAICYGRGAASAGPVADKAVFWSPLSSYAGNIMLVADNAAAQTLLQANGYRRVTDTKDAGCCNVALIGATAGTEVLRVNVA